MDFAYLWRHLPERLDPVFLRLGMFEIRWYGIAYVAAFLAVYALVRTRLASEKIPVTLDQVERFFVWIFAGVILGGRLGYVLIYDFSYFASHPIEIFWPFDGSGHYVGIAGMSYHGGALGFAAATFLFARRHAIRIWTLSDLLAPAIPLGYTFGRLGNFWNGELFGRVTDRPWGMFFPSDRLHVLRHPSQLYEAFFEGIFLFAVLWPLRKKNFGAGTLTAFYLGGYGLVRFFVEFTREPDAQLGTVLGPFSTGQLLCVTMVAAAIVILTRRPPLTSS